MSWVLWLRVSQKAAVRESARTGVISRLDWGALCFHAPLGLRQDSAPHGCWTEGLFPHRPWARGIPHFRDVRATHREAHNTAAGFPLSKQRSKTARQTKPEYFCNKIRSDIPVHSPYYIHQKGVTSSGLYWRGGLGNEHPEEGIAGSHLGSCPP